MKIVNTDLTQSMNRPGRCRWCGSSVTRLCGHHLYAKGHGGGRQIDIPCNLISLGMTPFDCWCHQRHHNSGADPSFEDLLAVSAADHDCLQGDIEDLVRLIQRMPRISEMSVERYESIVKRELNLGGRRLAMRQLESFAHLLGRAP